MQISRYARVLCAALPACVLSAALLAEEKRPVFDDLMIRVECTVWAEGRLEDLWVQHKANARKLNVPVWNRDAQELVAIGTALENYRNRHVFVWMDADTYHLVVEAHWPEGASDTERRASLCEGYLNRHFLRHVTNPDDDYGDWTR